MRRVEGESFFKGFLLFFVSLGLLNTLLFVFEYRQKRHDLEEKILTQMKVCSFELECDRFVLSFAPLQNERLYQLFHDEKGVYALFSIPRSEKYALRLSLSQEHYEKELTEIRNRFVGIYFGVMGVIAFLSALFSFYALSPLRRALRLTEEFAKDILHDFNTPLASLRLNVRMLQCPEEARKIERIEQSVETILALQENLRSYLEEHPMQNETLELSELIKERISLMQKLYPDIVFDVAVAPTQLHTNHDALIRVLDNLFSNAAKYNRPGGRVEIRFTLNELTIHDTGKGIRHPEKAFDRFYKEQERGIGIGLHIVKNLCDTMNVPVQLESTPDIGTTVFLDLSQLTVR